jgi:signal transduction histidine kinase
MKLPLSTFALNIGRCAVAAFFALVSGASARQTPELLTNAADVISLPAERASQQIKVAVIGIVTAADPGLKGRFFLQDATGGVFVDNANGNRPEPGDLVEVTGITHAGAYAPIITAPNVRKIGTAPLPAAKPIAVERLMSGAEDSQRIEISGSVRAARVDGQRLDLELVSGLYRFRVHAPLAPDTDAQKLLAAEVRVRGTAAEAHNRSLRQLIAAEVYVPVPADFIVEKSEAGDPFNQPAVSLNSLAQYHRDNSFNQRVHVKGTVTFQRPGEGLFLQDAAGGLQVQSRQQIPFSRGDVVEAVGFPNFENYLPVLQDAVFRKAPDGRAVVSAREATLEDVQNGLHHASFVSLSGKLIDRTIRPAGGGSQSARTTLVLQRTNFMFTAEADEPQGKTALAEIPLGSILDVNGVCLTEIDSDGKMKTFRILVGDASDVGIIKRPSWFTPQRLIVGLAALAAVLVVFAIWSVLVSKKNSVLKYLIREREKAQVELQHAHDLLGERVKERTAQLEFQITARKDSELQFKAVLSERTRLAQELHDTLEQSLTGIALQMDAAAKLFGRNSGDAMRHLNLARNLMGQSQVEVRRSVWDLRCRALEQFDLAGALLRSARQFTFGTSIKVEVESVGTVRSLPEVVEENLLRIAQEALTNVIKHSGAALVKIKLEFAPDSVALQISDDGQGFMPELSAGARDGHFGLLGMSERAKRIGGRLALTSAPAMGTTVRVEIPLGSNSESDAPEPATAEINL